ncbi:unnamed protein product [Fraxinus pennsylvanica]|uniref:DUF7903 domain-containing protein n=1 Tax=Fraxinus pennsylvanica TaxID=56036 RepID=A0AAD1Z0D7_9LAMI|nr:unnamed protein product [Fraxinus pennsylvanica]
MFRRKAEAHRLHRHRRCRLNLLTLISIEKGILIRKILPIKERLAKSIVYSENAIAKWFAVGLTDDTLLLTVTRLEPVALESYERKSGEKPLTLVELNQVRHMVADMSCLGKNLDLRLLLRTKRILVALKDEEIENIQSLIGSATLDSEVKGGLRWPLGKQSSADQYTVVGVWHTNGKTFKNLSMRLKVRHADRFDFRSSAGEVTREVILKMPGIIPKLPVQAHETIYQYPTPNTFQTQLNQTNPRVGYCPAALNASCELRTQPLRLRWPEAKAAANRFEGFAILKRQRAQALIENADLVTYKAMMALRIAETAQKRGMATSSPSIFEALGVRERKDILVRCEMTLLVGDQHHYELKKFGDCGARARISSFISHTYQLSLSFSFPSLLNLDLALRPALVNPDKRNLDRQIYRRLLITKNSKW